MAKEMWPAGAPEALLRGFVMLQGPGERSLEEEPFKTCTPRTSGWAGPHCPSLCERNHSCSEEERGGGGKLFTWAHRCGHPPRPGSVPSQAVTAAFSLLKSFGLQRGTDA